MYQATINPRENLCFLLFRLLAVRPQFVSF